MKTLTRLLPLLLLLPATGCVGLRSLDVYLPGSFHQTPKGSALTFTVHGEPRVYDRPVDLPRAQEDERFGLVVVDTRSLPPAWRLNGSGPGVVVATVDRASPLAIAGLRCGDRLQTINSEPVRSVQQVAKVLHEEAEVRLVVYPLASTTPTAIVARAEGPLHSSSGWMIPIVAGTASSPTGRGARIGPLGMVWNARSALLTDAKGTRYVERNEVALLLDLFAYESETDLATGKTQRRVRLFWFLSIGADLF